jgi:hypothetical protein
MARACFWRQWSRSGSRKHSVLPGKVPVATSVLRGDAQGRARGGQIRCFRLGGTPVPPMVLNHAFHASAEPARGQSLLVKVEYELKTIDFRFVGSHAEDNKIDASID